jgi:hypothetical protein
MSDCEHIAPTIMHLKAIDDNISFCEDCNKLMWQIRVEQLEKENAELKERLMETDWWCYRMTTQGSGLSYVEYIKQWKERYELETER